ncbi:flippase-like domain-containing protein [Paenibacillus sp. PR3]|uniref:Phosphatidylglycerol lysyltransferase n=1 Tax=Paenibacillus terricola TaxID=2763503 RepID=A0ABR8N1F7_9BACL|nr:lysylphosphatidylglycerol synthase domain-containing protein [Paenibacillus terricola]MBD3922017.1 flippase-like domain-containing protein [Paenibacillus terricola]
MAALQRWAPKVLKSILVVVTVYFVARSVPLRASDIPALLMRADYRFYASMLLFAVSLMMQASIWVLIVNASGAEGERKGSKLRLVTGLRIFIDSQFAKYIPGGFWNYAGRIVLATREGVPMQAQLAAILYENVLLVSAALVYALTLALSLGVYPLPLLSAAIVILGAAYLYYHRIATWIRHLLAPASRWKPLKKLFAKMLRPHASTDADGTAVLSRNSFFGYLACFLGSHFVMGMAFWMLTDSFDAGRIGLLYAAGTFAASWLLGLFSPLPGGLGVREGFLVYFLSFKLGTDIALHISVIARLWNIMAEVTFWLLIKAVGHLPKRVKMYE